MTLSILLYDKVSFVSDIARSGDVLLKQDADQSQDPYRWGCAKNVDVKSDSFALLKCL